jgi:alkylation response protein AidB-like acyl-CoA dehydrogenase
MRSRSPVRTVEVEAHHERSIDMTNLTTATRTGHDVLDAVHELSPSIAARAPEIEAGRRVPTDLLEQLVDAGCFQLLLPPSLGGIGADLPTVLDVLAALARADASTAWVVMIGAGSWLDLAGLPRDSLEELFADPGTIIAGAFNPTGSIAPADGGYRVHGRWSFASGCEHARWIFGNCVEVDADRGEPGLRIAVFAPDQVVIEDTWTVSGLCGTGSHHFHVDDAFARADRTLVPLVDEPTIDAPVVRIPLVSSVALAIASVALGTAHGALDDIVALASDKVPLLAHGPLAGDTVFHLELATADAEFRAARALLQDVAGAAWDMAVAGEPFDLVHRARMRAAAVWITERAAAVVDAAYRAGGGSSLYADHPLQRRLRDVHAITQHFVVKHETMAHAGAILAGQELAVPVF